MALKNGPRKSAFSLVEVVLAMAVCSFAVISILGLFTTGLQSTRESAQQIGAANLATTLISMRLASPTNNIGLNFAIPLTAMTNAYGPAYGNSSTSYVGSDGQTTTAGNAAYLITCQAGTNSLTGTGMSQVYLMLSWPPQVTAAKAAGRYELITEIPIR